jgi:hypothetical protein
MVTIPGFPYNLLPVYCGTLAFLKKPRSSIGTEIRPQSAFTAFRALLPSANYSAEWSGWEWQPVADSNGRMAHFLKILSELNRHYNHAQLTRQAPILKRAPNGYHYLQRAVTPDWIDCIALWEHIMEFFSRAEKPSDSITWRLFLMNMKGLRPDVVRTIGRRWHCGWSLHLLQLWGILELRRTWLESTKIQSRTGLRKDSEEDWTPQRFRRGLDLTKIQKSTGLYKDSEEDWTP